MTLAEKIIAFAETLRVPDGTMTGQPLRLRDWQKARIVEIYSEDAARRRIARHVTLSMGRKNGKTTLIAVLCLAHLCGPAAIRNGQLYAVAFDREQAAIVFKLMSAMVYMDGELSERLNIIESRKRIVDPVSGSDFQALSSETKGKHGRSSSFLIFDELAQFGTDRELYDVMVTSTGAHDNPLIVVISTQAASDTALLSELIDYGQRVQSGEIDDPTTMLFLYAVPEDADIWDESTWAMANPALGDFRNLEEMRLFSEKARCMPGAEATFRNLYLNQRVDSAAQFITREVWNRNAAPVDMATFEDCPVYGGLDLSGKNDLSALALVAKQAESEAWDCIMRFWAPAEGLRERADRDSAPYPLWRDSGHLIATPGRTVDYAYIARELDRIAADMHLVAIKFDRWRIDDLKRECDRIGLAVWVMGKDWSEADGENGLPRPDGICLVPHGQGYRDMNPAVEVLEDAMVNGHLRHGGHPVLTWCASNVRVQADPAGGRKFDKIKSTGRIDGIVALAMALNGAVSATPERTAAIWAEAW